MALGDHSFFPRHTAWPQPGDLVSAEPDDIGILRPNVQRKRPMAMAEYLLDMIANRLRFEDIEDLPFDFITAHQIDKERAVVFLVHDGQAQIIEDDGNLFPSDALITKLRLLME